MAMNLAAVVQAMIDGDTVYYAPQSTYDYIIRKRADLPGAPFTHDTVDAIPHGLVEQITDSKTPTNPAGDIVVTVGGVGVPLVRLFPSVTALKTTLKASLTARADQAEAIAAQDNSFADSVDEIGQPELTVSPIELDFGDSETSLTFDINNTGEGKLHWTASSSIPTKVTLDKASGALNFGTEVVTVSVNRTGIAPGTYNPTISVVTDGGNQEVTLTVIVG